MADCREATAVAGVKNLLIPDQSPRQAFPNRVNDRLRGEHVYRVPAVDRTPLAAREKDFDKRLEDHEKADFVIEVDGHVIGEIGLHPHMNRRAGVAHMGVGIYDPEYVGKGYGRDAVMTLLDWSFRILNLRRVALETLATNERAIRAYRACGFVEEGRLREHEYVDGRYVDIVAMGVLRSEWEKSRHG